ncbi:MAG: hypothetical protein WCK65_04175 [Rhodospirillaceae bacterium]
MMTTPVPKHPTLNHADKMTIWSLFRQLDDVLLRAPGFKKCFSADEAALINAKSDAIVYHPKHLAVLNIAASSLDAYKVVSWYGFFICKHTDDRCKISLLAAIYVLRVFLNQETGVKLGKATTSMLYYLAVNDGDEHKDEFGIGKNGLYMAFSTAHAALKIAKIKYGATPHEAVDGHDGLTHSTGQG